MRKTYQIRKITTEDFDQALELFKSGYHTEVSHHLWMPPYEDIATYVSNQLKNMIDKYHGWVAIKDDIVVGYMIGLNTGPLFGEDDGVVVPIYAHGAVQEEQKYIYQSLFEQAAQYWAINKVYSVAITIFAHDVQSKDLWFKNGFGMRCVDAIRMVEPIQCEDQKITVKKINQKELSDLFQLHKKHNEYYRYSPVFMPNRDEDPATDFNDWFQNENRHVFAAYNAGQPVGYLRIQKQGESIISFHESMMNITGAFVDPAFRKMGVASLLLNALMVWMEKNNFTACGVDYESINISGSSFWEKYFTPYSISLTRRFDARIKTYI